MTNAVTASINETSLDPENWDELKTLGHQMIDDMIDYLRNVEQRPVWNPIPEEVKKEYKYGIPEKPSSIFEVYREFKQNIMPYPGGNIHPKYFSWVQGTGTPFGALAELMAATMNSNAAMGDHSSLYIDKQVVEWCKQLMDFPADASGILVSGASIANITALTVARNTVISYAKNAGICATEGKLTAYCSNETHNCLTKAAEVIGIGNEQLRKIPVNSDYQLDLELLKAKIAEDRQNGFVPFCIIGNAGAVNTGAIDNLDELLLIAREEKMWFHIDGAFGALAKIVPEYQERLKAIADADSIAFDLHKWMYMPYEIGCVLFKDAAAHKRAFTSPANYLLAHERGLPGGPETTSNYGMELSRGFKALKVWMSLKEHGLGKYRTMIAQNISQAFYLGQLIEQQDELELLAAVTLNVVCFRYNPGGMDDDRLNALNKELLMQTQEQGIGAPSYTMLQGRYAIRAAITNQRTRRHHLEEMITGMVKLGKQIYHISTNEATT